MQNTGHVIAYVTTKIDDGNKNVFKVFPSSIDVDPFSTKSLSIIFKPECVGVCLCVDETLTPIWTGLCL